MDETLRITEIFVSIQGESTFAGLPCVFVRTTGCPLRCRWCDTAYAFAGGDTMTLEQVQARVLDYGVPLVEITGGEPLSQAGVLPLMTALCDADRTVLLETSGALDIAPVDDRVRVVMDIKCPDSGEQERNLAANLVCLKPTDEVKFVVASRRDYEFARAQVETHDLARRCSVLLSTVFGEIDRRQVVEWMLADRLPARFQLQMHKFIWPPNQPGV